MTPDSPGLMGALLIVIGLAFALLAVAIVLNRREARAEGRDSEAGSPDEQGEPIEGEAGTDQQAELSEEQAPGEGSTGDEPAQPEGAAGPMEPSEGDRTGPQRPPSAQQAEPLSPRQLLPVAELLREEVSGELILRLGDKYLRSPDEIESEADRRRLQYASADLATWFEGAGLPARAGRARRHAEVAPEGLAAAPPDRSAGGGPPGRDASEPARPLSMIEAINAIIEKKLAAAESGPRAIRLVPDPSGGVRVLIGVKSYPLEEVPDEGIKQLIRQAVGEWEARQ